MCKYCLIYGTASVIAHVTSNRVHGGEMNGTWVRKPIMYAGYHKKVMNHSLVSTNPKHTTCLVYYLTIQDMIVFLSFRWNVSPS